VTGVVGDTPILTRLSGDDQSIYFMTVETAASVDDWQPYAGSGAEGEQGLEFIPIAWQLEVWTGNGWTRLLRVVRKKCNVQQPMRRLYTATSTLDVTAGHPVSGTGMAVGTVLAQSPFPYIPLAQWMVDHSHERLQRAKWLIETADEGRRRAVDREDDCVNQWKYLEEQRLEFWKAFVEVRCRTLQASKPHAPDNYHIDEAIGFEIDGAEAAASWTLFAQSVGVALFPADRPVGGPDAVPSREDAVWMQTRIQVGDQPHPQEAVVRKVVALPAPSDGYIYDLETANGMYSAGVGYGITLLSTMAATATTKDATTPVTQSNPHPMS
jgi:hypothetical protein